MDLVNFFQAIEFVSMQHDDELWEVLISQSCHKPEMVRTTSFCSIKNRCAFHLVIGPFVLQKKNHFALS